MASISTDQAGGRRIQFQNGDGKRKAIRLGNVSIRKCEEWVRHIEQMLEANRFGQTVDHATVAWSEALPDELHEKLVVSGLVATRDTQVRTLRAFLDHPRGRVTKPEPPSGRVTKPDDLYCGGELGLNQTPFRRRYGFQTPDRNATVTIQSACRDQASGRSFPPTAE